MAHIFNSKTGDRTPIFIDPKTGRPDPTKGPDGKALPADKLPGKYRAAAEAEAAAKKAKSKSKAKESESDEDGDKAKGKSK